MKMRDLFITAISTLIVTILGGLGVYYFTKAPEKPKPAELLLYQVGSPLSFQTENNKLSIVTIRIGNFGDLTATNTSIAISLAGITIADKSVDFSTGAAASFKLKSPSDSQIVIDIPSLTPDEAVTVTLLLSDFSDVPPKVSVKSDNSIGEESMYFVKPYSLPQENLFEKAVGVLILLALIVLLVVIVNIQLRILRRKTFKALNNTAFLLLHNNFVDDALSIFEREIHSQGGDCYLFSNYALCLALKGQYDDAHRLVSVAKYVTLTKHDKAVVAFNHSLIMLLQGRISEGLSLFEESVNLKPKEIKGYVNNSAIVEQIKAKVKEFENILILRIH